jgi:hypothetical protein
MSKLPHSNIHSQAEKSEGRTNKVLLDEIYRWTDSYSRLPTLLSYWGETSAPCFFEVLGEVWSVCDNISQYARQLDRIFKSASRANLDCMMTGEELVAFQELPDEVTAYRGAYPCNANGFSYSMDCEIAGRFPTLNRYRIAGEHPVLITAKIPKSLCVLKLDRDEREIIATCRTKARIVSKAPIQQEAAP